MLKLKESDRKILLELIEDSSQPISEIARKVKATRQTVAKKIARFKSEGIIYSYMPKLDPEKLGLTTHAYIFMREDPSSEYRNANERIISALPQVAKFHRLFGKYDAILEVWVRSSSDLTKLVKKIHSLKGVRETETFIVHTTIKYKPEAPFIGAIKSA